jgi:threonine/homoserine/homoserine lactone efflux protein
MLALLVTGLALGLAYAAVPGAVNAEALRRGVAGGFVPAWSIQTGALVGDTLWALIGLTGAAVLIRIDAVAIAFGLVGAGFLFALARSALRAAIAGPNDAGATAGPAGNAFSVGMAFSLANPAGIAFWSGLGGGVLAAHGGASAGNIAALLLAFTIGAFAWGCGMAGALHWSRRFAGGRVFRAVDAFCGLALSYFGVRLLWSSARKSWRWLAPAARVFG